MRTWLGEQNNAIKRQGCQLGIRTLDTISLWIMLKPKTKDLSLELSIYVIIYSFYTSTRLIFCIVGILSEKIKLFMFNTLVPLCLCFVAAFCNFINCLVSFIIGKSRNICLSLSTGAPCWLWLGSSYKIVQKFIIHNT